MEKHADGFIRNHFEDGMLLSATDLTNLQNYFDGKRLLNNSYLVGYGIVFGLSVEVILHDVVIGSGLAIDRQGREIYLPKPESVSISSLFPNLTASGEYYLFIEYAENFCGEALVLSENKLYEPVCNRIRETFRLSVSDSFECGNVCIAIIEVEASIGVLRISSVKPPARNFHLAPIWRELQAKYRSGSIYIGKETLPDEDGVFRTDEISHGLGSGKDVIIELSVKSYDKFRECEVFGDPGLFGLQVQTASKLYNETGAFVVAVRPQDLSMLPLCVRWHAYVAQGDNVYV